VTNLEQVIPQSDAFDVLRAEYEREWLQLVYVQPQLASRIGGDRSVVVVGGDGAGKTSTRLWLARLGSQKPQRLVVDWILPQPDPPGRPGLQTLEMLQTDLLRTCVRELVRFTCLTSVEKVAESTWLRESVAWLVQRCAGAQDRFFIQLRRSLTLEQAQLLDELLQESGSNAAALDASLSDILSEFTAVVAELDLHGAWVLLDGLEGWLSASPTLLDEQVRILLSTLNLFEAPGLALKLFAPDTLENSLLESGAVISRRLDVVSLRWQDAELQQIVERRLARLLGTTEFHLGDLGDAKFLLDRLRTYGGQRPLGWLQLLRPFADDYMRNAPGSPLPTDRCMEIWRSHPPRLYVDSGRQRVYLAFRDLAIEGGSAFRLVQYLYENRQRICAWDELYYVGYRGYEQIASHPADERYEYPKNWKHTLEMAVSRLRKAIDCDPHNPPYLVTERQRGVRLQNVT